MIISERPTTQFQPKQTAVPTDTHTHIRNKNKTTNPILQRQHGRCSHVGGDEWVLRKSFLAAAESWVGHHVHDRCKDSVDADGSGFLGNAPCNRAYQRHVPRRSLRDGHWENGATWSSTMKTWWASKRKSRSPQEIALVVPVCAMARRHGCEL